MNFKSTQVEKAGDTYNVTEDLTIHSVTREVVLEVGGSLNPLPDPYGMSRVGGVATTKTKRADFGLK